MQDFGSLNLHFNMRVLGYSSSLIHARCQFYSKSQQDPIKLLVFHSFDRQIFISTVSDYHIVFFLSYVYKGLIDRLICKLYMYWKWLNLDYFKTFFFFLTNSSVISETPKVSIVWDVSGYCIFPKYISLWK